VGHIYLRQEKYDLAESHFRRALSINPSSSVLYCYLGMALHKLGRPDHALDHLDMAITADRHNPLAKFEKAAVMLALEQYEPALRELQALRTVLPREASVFFQIGKICKKLNRLEDAIENFNIALDLKPPSSDANLIKVRLWTPTYHPRNTQHTQTHTALIHLYQPVLCQSNTCFLFFQSAIDKVHLNDESEDEEI
jgi:anaphase-promoting complex subunit 3